MKRLKNGSGRDSYGIVHAPPPAMLNAARRLPTSTHLRLLTMPQDDSRTSDTLAPPTDREAPTQPHASERPAIAPPAPQPTPDELATTALASRKPPEWWESSFIGQALGKFAADAEDIRKGRERQHREQMAKLEALSADNALIRGELSAFRRAVHAKDADHDRQLADLRAELAALRARVNEQQATLEVLSAVQSDLEKALREAEARPAAPPETA